jgi:hypothetical protein
MNSKQSVRRAFHFDKPDRVPISCINLKSDFFPNTQYQPRTWQKKYFILYIPSKAITRYHYRKLVYKWKNFLRN